MSSKVHFDALIAGEKAPPPPVAHALQDIGRMGYREAESEYDWVPGPPAYALYIEQCKGIPCTRAEFGLAFRLAFPDAGACTRRRCSDGKRFRGWSGVTGPEGLRSTDSDNWSHIKKLRSQSLTPPESVA